MGSTGHGIYKRSRTGINDETFGIAGAVTYKGKVPKNSGLDPVGSNKITIKLPAGKQSNILFQFKLNKDKFIDDCIFEINNKLKFMRAKNEYKVETGKAKFNDSQMFLMEEVKKY